MEKGTNVTMRLEDEWINGTTMETAAPSPTERTPNRKVTRVKWEDGTESIEDIADLIPL